MGSLLAAEELWVRLVSKAVVIHLHHSVVSRVGPGRDPLGIFLAVFVLTEILSRMEPKPIGRGPEHLERLFWHGLCASVLQRP